MAAIYVKVNGRYVAIPTLKGDTSDVSNDIISDAQSIVLPPSVKAIKDYVDDELDDALISAINSGDFVIAFNKYSDLPETGHYAYVRTNETTSQTGSVELVEGNQYTLYLNPAPNFDVERYGFSITGATGFDDNKYHVFNGAGIVLSIVGIKGTETHIWRYGALGETLYDGWWYLVREFNETISAVQIDYSELPVLSGTVSHDGSALNLGFLLASETPYNTNKFGLYRYDENLEQWVWTDSGLLEKFSEVNDQLYYDGLPISGDSTITVNKYSDISETNAPLICVKYDETIPQEQFDFEADTEYSLFVNPQIPLNLAFDAVFHPTETSEYVANAIALQLNLTDYSAPVFSIVGVINNNGTITYKMWFYTVNGAIKAAAGELPDLTILSGWSYIEVTDNTIVTNEAINYFTLPALEGIFAEANELGGTYFSETPYSVNNSGLYNYDTDLEKWVRVDGDNSLWCEATGFLSKAFGYGNSTPGQLSFAGGGSGLIASAPNSAIFGRYGETTPHTLLCIANGAELDRNSLAFNVDADMAEFFVPTVAPKRLEYYGQYETVLICDILNTLETTSSVELVLPTVPYLGFFGEFKLLINVTNAEHLITFNMEVEWEDATPYDFSAGVHIITGFYNNFTLKWALSGRGNDFTPDLSGYEELANKVTTIDVDSTDTEYPSAKAVYDFVPEVDLVPTMTEYNTVLTLNNGNYWTTTASIQFALPTPESGKINTFDLLVKVADGGHTVTFSAAVEWSGSVAYVFGVGTHIVSGIYDVINSKWLLTATAGGVPA